MKSIVKSDSPLVSPPSDFKGDFFKGTASNVLNHLELLSVSLLLVSNGGVSSAEIQSGLIGVGLINVEDMSGILTLDKGICLMLNISIIVAVDMPTITHKLVYTRLQTTTTSASSWTVFWAWRSISRTLCSSTSLTRWQQSYKKQRGTADTIWGFLVGDLFFVAFTVNATRDANNLPALDLGSGDEKVKKLDCRKFLTPGYTTSGHVELHTVCLSISVLVWILWLHGLLCSSSRWVFVFSD